VCSHVLAVLPRIQSYLLWQGSPLSAHHKCNRSSYSKSKKSMRARIVPFNLASSFSAF
jgi:hypothetical protein